MFQFPGFPSIRYGLAYGSMRSSHRGFPIRISPDHWIFAPPRSFSQLVTSFIGSQCLGIHPAPFMLDLSFGLPSAIALAFGGSRFMNCSVSFSANGYGCQFPSKGLPSSGSWSFWFDNVTFVTPRMSSYLLRLNVWI